MANGPHVRVGDAKAFRVWAHVVLDTVLLKQSLHTVADLGVAILRHRGKQMVLNLEIQVCHPPVAPPSVGAICGMVRRVQGPRDVLIFRDNVLMRVAHGEIREDVSGADRNVGRIQSEGSTESKVSKCHVPENVAHSHVEDLNKIVHTKRVIWVLNELPPVRHEGADRTRKKQRCLSFEPELAKSRANTLADEFVECDERQSLQVWVGSQFLRCRVVLVVLVAPIAARHTAAEAIHEHLDVAVDLDVPGERVVAAFCCSQPQRP